MSANANANANANAASTPDLVAMEASALASYESGDVQGALARFRNLLSMNQTHQTALRFLAFEAGLRGDHAAAVGFLVRAADAYPQDLVVLFDLGRAQVALEQWTMALDTFERMLLLDAGNIDAMLHCGHCMERLGQTQDVALAYLRATRAAEGLDPRQIPNQTKRFLNYALEFVRTYLDGEIELSLAPIESEFGREALARIRKAADIYVGKRPLERAHAKWRPGLLYVPDLPVRTWFERGEFDWVEKVETAVDAVRDELLGILGIDDLFKPYVDHAEGTHGAKMFREINRSRDWTSFHFYRHGKRVEANCMRCPRTAELLDAVTDLHRVPGYGPEAMFSILRPHSRIPAHYGSVNGRLVVHLPLIVPPNCGALKVVDEARAWEYGRLLIFDDTFEHEAWNSSDQTRAVLIFDVWNPYLSAAEREGFRRVLTTAQKFEQAAV